MQCIRHPMAKCLFPNLSELQPYEWCWGEEIDRPRQFLLGKQLLGPTVHLSPLPWEQGEGSRQEWEKCIKRKPWEPQDWGGRDPNTSITLLPERSGDIGGSLQHPQPLCLGRAETVHHQTQRVFRRVSVAPEEKRADINKFSYIKKIKDIIIEICLYRSGI